MINFVNCTEQHLSNDRVEDFDSFKGILLVQIEIYLRTKYGMLMNGG